MSLRSKIDISIHKLINNITCVFNLVFVQNTFLLCKS